jgi:hypothetical protein
MDDNGLGGMSRSFFTPFLPIYLYIIDGEMTWFGSTVILVMAEE